MPYKAFTYNLATFIKGFGFIIPTEGILSLSLIHNWEIELAKKTISRLDKSNHHLRPSPLPIYPPPQWMLWNIYPSFYNKWTMFVTRAMLWFNETFGEYLVALHTVLSIQCSRFLVHAWMFERKNFPHWVILECQEVLKQVWPLMEKPI